MGGVSPPPRVTFRRVVAPLRGPGQFPVLHFACCVGSLLSVGRCGRCSCWCCFRPPPPPPRRSGRDPAVCTRGHAAAPRKGIAKTNVCRGEIALGSPQIPKTQHYSGQSEPSAMTRETPSSTTHCVPAGVPTGKPPPPVTPPQRSRGPLPPPNPSTGGHIPRTPSSAAPDGLGPTPRQMTGLEPTGNTRPPPTVKQPDRVPTVNRGLANRRPPTAIGSVGGAVGRCGAVMGAWRWGRLRGGRCCIFWTATTGSVRGALGCCLSAFSRVADLNLPSISGP